MPYHINDPKDLEARHYFPERRSAIRVKGSIYRRLNLNVDLKIAETREELEAAFRIVHDAYVEQGYIKPHPNRLKVSKYHSLPNTLVIIARENGHIIATVSLVIDSYLGLPCEQVFREEVALIRQNSLRIAEVSALAISQECRNKNITMNLYQTVVAFAEFCGVTDMLIVVNPHHVRFYKDVCFFEIASGVRNYILLSEGVPGVLLRNTLPKTKKYLLSMNDWWDQYDADLFSFFFSRNILLDNAFLWNRMPMTPENLRYFFIEKTNLFDILTKQEIELILTYYPYTDLRSLFVRYNE